MIQMNGERQVSVPPDRLYSEMVDLTRLVHTLPDVSKVKSITEDQATFVVKPGLAFVKGELDTVVQRVQQDPPHSATLAISSKGVGTSSKVQATFHLEPAEGGTLLRWTADVLELGGLLKFVPSGLLKGAGKKVFDTWITGLEQQLT